MRAAYTRAMEELALRVEPTAEGSLRAARAIGPDVETVTVAIGRSDTLATRASISYRYAAVSSGIDVYHYPYQLAVRARRHLDRDMRVTWIPERIFPASMTSCPGAAPPDSLDRLNEPQVVGGPDRLASRVQYPEEARRAEVEGVVYLAAVVSEQGTVSCVEVLSGLPLGMTEAAVAALMKATFMPATVEGRPIARKVVVPIRFKLM